MISIYIRLKIDGKRTFRAAPAEPGEQEYWLKSNYNGRQKWHRVGRYDGVKKAKLLLEREQERNEAARKYGLVAPASTLIKLTGTPSWTSRRGAVSGGTETAPLPTAS